MTPTATTLAYGSRTNSTVAMPSGVQEGDLLILWFLDGAASEAPDPTTPTDFTALPGPGITDVSQDSFNVETRRWSKFATIADETATDITVTHATASSKPILIRIPGADLTTPFPVTPTTRIFESGEGFLATAPGLTTVDDNTLLLFWMHDFTATVTPAVPTGFTQLINDTLGVVAWKIQETAGATGDASMATSNATSDNPWVAGLIAVKMSAVLPPENTTAPVVTGTAQVGEVLTSDGGEWDNIDDPGSQLTYQWQRLG